MDYKSITGKITAALEKIRKPECDGNFKRNALYGGIFLLAGTLLGVFSKWLDATVIDDGVWWQRLLGATDLGNVFSEFSVWLFAALAISVYAKTPLNAALRVFLFFAGMCAAYHAFSVIIAGFNPMSYMMIWYGFTILSPLLAVLCWYAKGKSVPSLVLCTLILWVMTSCCFSTGLLYFGFISATDTLIFIAAAVVLYVSPKNTAISLALAFVLAIVFRLPLV